MQAGSGRRGCARAGGRWRAGGRRPAVAQPRAGKREVGGAAARRQAAGGRRRRAAADVDDNNYANLTGVGTGSSRFDQFDAFTQSIDFVADLVIIQ
ncbi:hypothetical protein [Oryza sativa Japonica Group]|uniref:Uncharacterized protein n=1 Tax=Oryza sativa subsp. japonica TaxID=39947 RepID=Q94CN5_ORYSJ|nr:hypothetical protein [Oryza sativa Japonica Group]